MIYTMHFFNNLLWFFGIGTKPIPKQISTPFQQTDNHSTYNGYFFQYGDQIEGVAVATSDRKQKPNTAIKFYYM